MGIKHWIDYGAGKASIELTRGCGGETICEIQLSGRLTAWTGRLDLAGASDLQRQRWADLVAWMRARAVAAGADRLIIVARRNKSHGAAERAEWNALDMVIQ